MGCGASIKKRDEKTLFEELREKEVEEITLKLNMIKMKFQPKNGNWKSK